MRKHPKIKNAMYYKGKLIGINSFVDSENERVIYEELPKKQTVDVDINRVNSIINLSDIRKPSFYYRFN
jgi:hypothetical protein